MRDAVADAVAVCTPGQDLKKVRRLGENPRSGVVVGRGEGGRKRGVHTLGGKDGVVAGDLKAGEVCSWADRVGRGVALQVALLDEEE